GPSRTCRSWTGSRPTARSSVAGTTGSTSPGTTLATCAGTRSSRSATPAGRSTEPCSPTTWAATTSCCASTPGGRSAGWSSALRPDVNQPARLIDTERWIAWVRVGGLVFALFEVGLFSYGYQPGYESSAWTITGLFADGVLPVLGV